MAGELIRSAEALGAALELASVRLLTGVGADVSGLVFEAVESLIAQGALVWTWQVGSVLPLLPRSQVGHHAHGCHLCSLLLLLLLLLRQEGQFLPRSLLLFLEGRLRVQ